MPDDGLFGGVRSLIPPGNLVAEQSLLGAILAKNAAYFRVSAFLRPAHFVDPVNGRIFAAAERRIQAGQLADAVTLQADFLNDGSLDELGGSAYLARLLASMVAIDIAGDYGRVILDAWVRRQQIEIGAALSSGAYTSSGEDNGREALERLAAIQADGSGLMSRVSTLGEAAAAAIAGYERTYKGEPSPALRSGFVQVDNLLGGFMPKHLIILGGRSGMGKTSLAQQLGEGVAARLLEEAAAAPPFSDAGGWVLVFSQEMTAEELGGRAVATATSIPGNVLQAGELSPARCKALIDAQVHLAKLPLVIVDSAGLSAADIVSGIRSLSVSFRIRLVIIDHLQKMRHTGRGDASAIGRTTSDLKDAAKFLGLPILLLAQLSRDTERRPDPRPVLADLSYAGEVDADVVAMVWRPEKYHPPSPPEATGKEKEETLAKRREDWFRRRDDIAGQAELIVAKRRGGETGALMLAFDGATTSFRLPGIRLDNPSSDDLWDRAAAE